MAARTPVVEVIDPMMVEILRKKTPAEKLAQAFSMWDFALEIMGASILSDHPDWSSEQIHEEKRRRLRRDVVP